MCVPVCRVYACVHPKYLLGLEGTAAPHNLWLPVSLVWRLKALLEGWGWGRQSWLYFYGIVMYRLSRRCFTISVAKSYLFIKR